MSRSRQFHRWQIDEPDDFTTTPLTISFILSGILLLLILLCRCFIVFRKWKNRRANEQANSTENASAQPSTVGQTNGPPLPSYPDEPPSYDAVQTNQGQEFNAPVPCVYVNMALEDDAVPPPKYHDIVKETPPLTAISDSSK